MSNGRVRDLGVPVATVADESCPRLATQYFAEFDPGNLQLTQSPGGFCYPSLPPRSQHLDLFGKKKARVFAQIP